MNGDDNGDNGNNGDSDDKIVGDLTAKDIIEKDIFELLGAQTLSDAEKQDLAAKMLETINLRVIDRIDEGFSDEEIGEWGNLINEGKTEKIDQFMKSKNIDVEALMLEEALKYKAEIATYSNYNQQADKLKDEVGEMIKNPPQAATNAEAE